MNVDLVILGILLFGAYNGYKKGLVKGILGTVSIFVGFGVAIFFYNFVYNIVNKQNISNSVALPAIVFVAIFVATLILINIFAKTLEKIIKGLYLGSVNKLGGIALGMLKYLLIIMALVVIFSRINYLDNIANKNSVIYNFLKEFVNYLLISKL